MSRFDKLKNRKIYLMPANIHAAYLHHVLKRNGIQTAGIFDNAPYKDGMLYDGIPIFKPFASSDPEKDTVVCVMIEYEDIMREQLMALGYNDIMVLPDVIQKDDPRDAVSDIIIEQISPVVHNASVKLSTIDGSLDSNLSFRRSNDFVKINDLSIVPTTHCSLRCKHCASLIPYYKSYHHSSKEIVERSVDALFKNIDYCAGVSIMGGEALTYPYLPEIISCVNNYRNKIGRCDILTNGTILPNDKVLRALKQNNLELHISRYPVKESIADAVYEKARSAGVECCIFDYDYWFDACNIIPPDSDIENIKRRFEQCKCRCNILLDGKLWYCSFIANANPMGIIKPDKEDYVDLLSDSPDLRENIRRLVNRAEAFPGCIRCGGFFGIYGKRIPVAEQAQGELFFKKWTEYSDQ